jgi:prephenate dehydrogenase
MAVYDDFLERKNKGEKLDLNALTREELKTMWHDEIHFDRDIAKLFDVTESRVRTLRKRMGLMLRDIQFEERVKTIRMLEDASTGMAATMESLSKKDRDQFEHFIEELTSWLKKNK